MVPEVSEEKGTYVSPFYRWFYKVISGVFYFLWLSPVLLALFWTVASLKVLPMIVFDAEIKMLDTFFLQHTIGDLNFNGTFIALFNQENL